LTTDDLLRNQLGTTPSSSPVVPGAVRQERSERLRVAAVLCGRRSERLAGCPGLGVRAGAGQARRRRTPRVPPDARRAAVEERHWMCAQPHVHLARHPVRRGHPRKPAILGDGGRYDLAQAPAGLREQGAAGRAGRLGHPAAGLPHPPAQHGYQAHHAHGHTALPGHTRVPGQQGGGARDLRERRAACEGADRRSPEWPGAGQKTQDLRAAEGPGRRAEALGFQHPARLRLRALARQADVRLPVRDGDQADECGEPAEARRPPGAGQGGVHRLR